MPPKKKKSDILDAVITKAVKESIKADKVKQKIKINKIPENDHLSIVQEPKAEKVNGSFLEELKSERISGTPMTHEITMLLLDRCLDTIKLINKIGNSHYTFEVPYIVFGYPEFNVNEITLMVNTELKKKGLKTMYLEPNRIYISWT